MSRTFSTFVVDRSTGDLLHLDRHIAAVCGFTLTDNGYRVTGAGMDMRFHVADVLAARLRRDLLGDQLVAWGLDELVDGNSFDLRTV